MRNIIIASAFCIFINVNFLYSHGQDVHQHIVREAWKLVEYQVPELIGSDIANWIGNDQTLYCLCVVSGAYNEDEQDIIYRNCGWNFLTGCVMTSVNHFWDADAGDNSTFNWNGNHANALEKANHMYYGTHLWDFATAWDPNHLIWEVDHNGLPDLYLTGNYVEYGYFNNIGQHFNLNPPAQDAFTTTWRKRTSYDILGRICHLLGDMSIPAHAHNDAHSPLNQGGVDTYEEWCKSFLNPFGGAYAYTFEDALLQGGILFDVLEKYYPIRYLMYVTNQCADFFPSDGDFNGLFLGDRNYSTSYSYNGQLDEYPILDQIFSELGNPPTNIDVENQANLLMPLVIRTTASLLLLFAAETNQWNPILNITVKNDFEYGKIMFDNIVRNSPYSTTIYYGSKHSFGAVDQYYQEPGQPEYYREFYEWCLPDGRIDSNRTLNVNVFVGGIYLAKTKKHYEYSASNNFINNNTIPGFLKINDHLINLPCSSYVKEQDQIKTEAPPQQQTVKGRLINYNFQQWASGPSINSNPRIFIPNDHFAVQAIYKGHRVSSSADALSSNSQRKMIFDGAKYHLVYEDQGEIYYSNSNDGVNWTPEVRVSNGSGLNKGASIASDYISTIAIAWQEADQILVRTRSSAGQWGQIRAVDPPLGSDAYDATPVIDYGYDFYYYIVWRNYELLSQSYDLRIVAYHTITENFGTIYQVPKTSNYSKNPSMISSSQGHFHLVWEENLKIYYTKFNPEDGAIPLSCFQIKKEQVSEATAWTSHMYPCITLTYNQYPNVMWQAHNIALESDVINHRRRTFSYPGGWGTTTTFTGKDQNFVKPSISGFPEIAQNYKLKSSWRSEYRGLYVANYNGSSWTTNFITNPYYFDPNVVVNKSTSNYSKMVYRSYNSPPYFLNATAQFLESGNEEGGYNKITEGANIKHHRRGIVKVGQSEIAFELGGITINGQDVQFFPLSDSLMVGQNATLNQVFRTMPFQISPRSRLNITIGSTVTHRDSLLSGAQSGKEIKFSLNVIDIQSGQVLFNLDKWSAIKNLPSDTLISRTFVFRLRETRNVYLSVELNLSNGISAMEALNEVYYLSENGQMTKSSSSKEEINLDSLVPDKFMLYQNYPNPFNPSTTISFDLPTDVMVRLEIFDITGQEIRTLINEPKEAGTHQVVWNGQDDNGHSVASGLYVYRIQAGDFVQSKKLLFMK